MDFLESLVALESNAPLHSARLLILLNAFHDRNGRQEIEGLTKLAKLDFFLRYPVMLEKALEARRRSAKLAEVQPYERNSVESKMVRYRYGPWDHRYRQFLALMVGQGLVQVRKQGLGFMIGLTDRGHETANMLAEMSEFVAIARRAEVLRDSLDLTATGIMRFVYETFPEIASLKLNEEIEA